MSHALLVLALVLSSFPANSANRIDLDYFKKYYVSEKGFRVELKGTKWERVPSAGSEAILRWGSAGQSTATLTLRVDDETKSKTLQDYVKFWLPKFPQFGLDVVQEQFFKITPTLQAFIVDLSNPGKSKYVRQVIFHRDAGAVIMTCMDSPQKFKTTVEHCNQLIKSFSWIDIPKTN